MRKRFLIISAVAAALALSAVVVVTLSGNDKPIITTNPPAADEQPANAPVNPTEAVVTPDQPQGPPAPDDDDQPEVPGHNGNGNGNGNSGSDKAHGLERAMEVHERNVAKKLANDKAASTNTDVPKGLQNSMDHLELNMEKLSDKLGSQQSLNDDGAHGQGQANGHGHSDHT